MKYLLLIHQDEEAWLNMSEAGRRQIMADAVPHVEQLRASGEFLGGAPLHPTTDAATVRLSHGKPLVTDGPFAETREQIAGYSLVEARDRDAAIAIAARFLGTRSIAIIEVRAVEETEGSPTH